MSTIRHRNFPERVIVAELCGADAKSLGKTPSVLAPSNYKPAVPVKARHVIAYPCKSPVRPRDQISSQPGNR